MKATQKLTERKYYKKFSWTQPTLTSNGSFGGDEIGVEVGYIGGVTGFSGTAYTIFQPNTGTIYMDGDMYRTTLYLDIYIPHDFVITGFTFGNNYVTDASSGCYYSYLWGGTHKGETATQLAYKDSVGEGGSFRMDLGSNTHPYRYYRFQTSTWGAPYEDTMWFGKVLIEGYYIEEATSSDYDFYKDTYGYSIPITKIERKYYTYEDESWIQPYLTSNRTMGGSLFAASAITEYNSSYQAYMAFDSSTSSEWASMGTQNPSWISFYNPEPIKVTKLTMQNRTSAENFTAGKVYGSNNNYYWEEVGSYSTTVTSANATWEIDLSNNTKYYKYYKITGTSMTGTNQGFTNITITAVHQKPAVEPSSFQPEFIERKYYKYDTTNPVYNINIVGTLTITDGVIKDFGTSNYAVCDITQFNTSQKWENVICFTTSSDVTTYQCITNNSVAYWGYGFLIMNGKLLVALSNSSSSYNIVENTSTTVSSNTKYWVKTTFDGFTYKCTYSTDKTTWTTIFEINNTSSVTAGIPRYGLQDNNEWPFFGSIDLKESYLKVNDELWWEGVTYPVIGGNEQDYDFYEDVYNYDFYKDINTYKAIKSYEKGQYYGGNN